MFQDFYCVSHCQLPTLYITITAFWKWIVYPSAGTVTDPVWRTLLAVSVSQFRLSVCVNQVRHHPSSRSRKISPFPASSGLCYGPSDYVFLWVQLHLNREKGRNVWYKTQTMDTAEGVKDCLGRSPAEILGSNPTGGMDICLLWVSCVVR